MDFYEDYKDGDRLNKVKGSEKTRRRSGETSVLTCNEKQVVLLWISGTDEDKNVSLRGPRQPNQSREG